MTELVTSAQMRALEAALFASGALTPHGAMESAGAAVAAAVRAWFEPASPGAPPGPWAAPAPPVTAVLCGPGNNGGDGYVVARHLALAGWCVRILNWPGAHCAGAPDPGPPAASSFGPAADMRALWAESGLAAQPDEPLSAEGLAGVELVVDALFGIGLRRPLQPEGGLGAVIARLEQARAAGPAGPRVVALDVPSGLCADTGQVAGVVLRADLTISIGHPKVGQVLARGPRACGFLEVVAAGLDAPAGSRVRLAAAPAWDELAKPVWSDAGQGAHKYDHGHVLVLAGGAGHGGAARLAARAALRIGAGLVTLGCPEAALAENAARLDAVMLRAIDDGAALGRVLADRRWRALCLGPGLGLGSGSGLWRTRELVAVALADGRPAVLDADALGAFADAPAELFAQLHPQVVLSPHAGEFARLFPDLAAAMAPAQGALPALSRVQAARAAAARAGAVVLLKGPDSVLAAPDADAVVHLAAYGREAPWLATAGAGDVLAGMIAGLMGRGLPPMRALEAAVWLHVEAARSFGPGLIAEDLPEALPGVLRQIALQAP
jgi:hydroxyethylthiazole kinase-like uncharacterized protein yjeF